MKKSLLSLLMIVGMLLITCGNEPPEEFYNGTPEDSTAIQTLLDNNPELQVGTDMFDTSMNTKLSRRYLMIGPFFIFELQ